MKKSFKMILCMNMEGGIGYQNQLRYVLKRDQRFFRAVTMGNTVAMGRKTWESIGQKPLKWRKNIIISRTIKPSQYVDQGVQVFGNLNQALEQSYLDKSKFYVIGGKGLYEEGAVHELCDSVYLTRVGVNEKCDVHLDRNIFKDFEYEVISKTMNEGQINFDFTKLIKKTKQQIQIFKKDPYITNRHEEYQYLDMISKIIREGKQKSDRTGVGTLSIFGDTMRFDLSNSFPLLTTKKVFMRGVIEELLWFIRGETDGNKLLSQKIKIWEGNGSRQYLDSIGLNHREEHDLGPIYGFQWRHFGAKYTDRNGNYAGQGVDQLNDVIQQIKNNPESRRIIMSAWNPVDLQQMALPPCHVMSQFNVTDGALNCMMIQRSCDFGLGVPFNIASYALLTCLLADICNLKRGEFIHVLGDTHIYTNHLDQLQQQVKRVPYPFPVLSIKNKRERIEDYQYEDFELIGYQNHERIQMKMAV